MKHYSFSLVLGGITYDTPNFEDALYESCDDALICGYGKTVYLEFEREASSYQKALMSAISDIESANINAVVMSVDAGDYVGLSDIAELSDITKQSIALLKDGKRGNGKFPSPVLRLSGKNALWQWGDVAKHLAEQGKIDPEMALNAKTTEEINIALQLRNKEKQDAVLTMLSVLTEQQKVVAF